MSDFYATAEHPTARKAHQCDTCARHIDPGETYLSQFGIWEGAPYRFKQCAHCVAVWNIWAPEDGNRLISENGYDEWQVNAYPTSVSEARAIVCFRRQWRRKDGTLHPIPSLPSASNTSQQAV